MKKCQSFSVCVCVCFSFCWLPYPSLLLLFFFCTYLDVFSLSFIFFSSSETKLIKIIHMQAVYRSSLTTLTNVVWETFHIFLFSFSFCYYFIWFHFNCFFSCTRQIFRFPLLLFFLSRVARHSRASSSSSASSSSTSSWPCFSPSSAQEIHLTRRVL